MKGALGTKEDPGPQTVFASTSVLPLRSCFMGTSQRSTPVMGPLAPYQRRGDPGKSRAWRLGLLKALVTLVQELVAALRGPLAASSAFTVCSEQPVPVSPAVGGQLTLLGLGTVAEMETLLLPAKQGRAWGSQRGL